MKRRLRQAWARLDASPGELLTCLAFVVYLLWHLAAVQAARQAGLGWPYPQALC
jgi:hypothetical protein